MKNQILVFNDENTSDSKKVLIVNLESSRIFSDRIEGIFKDSLADKEPQVSIENISKKNSLCEEESNLMGTQFNLPTTVLRGILPYQRFKTRDASLLRKVKEVYEKSFKGLYPPYKIVGVSARVSSVPKDLINEYKTYNHSKEVGDDRLINLAGVIQNICAYVNSRDYEKAEESEDLGLSGLKHYRYYKVNKVAKELGLTPEIKNHIAFRILDLAN